MDRIIEILNNRNDNNFTYLKIYDVEYLTNEKICTFTLLYPESTKEISSSDREKITKFFIDYLKLNSKVVVKFKKSYLENNLILKEILQFLKNNYSSVFAYISEDQIKIENKNIYIEICFNLAKNVIENIEKFK